jgi:spermidine synthase
MARVYRDSPRRYVVVRAGRRTLRIDGSFASSWEPGRVTTGSVWDALAAALLALPPARRRRVLLLGLGGASAARCVRALAPRARIVGVEIDPAVVRLARRWFDLDALGIEVVIGDAAAYLARARGRYDAVLEDVFTGAGRRLRKPPGFPEPALDHVRRLLAPGGVAACNTLDEAAAVRRALAARFRRLACIGVDGYDNRIYVASDGPLSAAGLRDAVARDPVLGASLRTLSFRRVNPRPSPGTAARPRSSVARTRPSRGARRR